MKIFVATSANVGKRLLSYLGWLTHDKDVQIVAVRCSSFDENQTARAFKYLVQKERPDAVLFPSTSLFRAVAPLLAAMLEVGLTADCTELKIIENGMLLQTRPALGGSVTADILSVDSSPQMATIREDALSVIDSDDYNSLFESLELPFTDPVLQLVSDELIKTGQKELRTARIIISGGKGIGGQKGFDRLRQLADLIPGAALGASRGAVSASYAPYHYQIGLTGECVSPDLYIAFGISGAVQHIVGIKNAAKIIAVNIDKNAPIFDYSDIAIIAPWEDTVQLLIELIVKQEI